MKRNENTTGKGNGMPIGIIVGVLASLAITLICSAVVAWLISAETMSMNSVGYAAGCVLLLSASGGTWIATMRIKRLRTQVCLITGGAYYLVLLAITAMFFDGQYQGMGIAAILVIAGSGLIALLGIRERKKPKRKFKKGAFC